MKTIFLILVLMFSHEIILAQYFEWVKGMGRSVSDCPPNSIATDANGNVYITGYFAGTIDFDPGIGIYNLSSSGNFNNDIFICKLDAFGNFLWAKQIGSNTGADVGKDIAVDGLGNVYVVGCFTGTADFDGGSGVYNLTSSDGEDIFVLKLDTNGNLIWVIGYGGSSEDRGQGIILDATNNLYITGCFAGTIDFDPGVGVANLSSISRQTFVCKLDSDGGYIWAKNMSANNGFSQANAITLDNMNNIYTTGYFHGTVDFNPGSGVANLMAMGGNYDIFISKLDSNGNFVWIKHIGGPSDETVNSNSIAVDITGNVYTTGVFIGGTDFDPGMNTITLNSTFGNTFVSKLDINGDFVWVKQLDYDVYAVISDANSNIYMTGGFSGTQDFDPNSGVFNLVATNDNDYISKWDSNGNLIWVKQMEGFYSVGVAITIDALENIYSTGFFAGTVDFDPDMGVHNLASVGSAGDIFIHKMNALPTPITKIENDLACTLYPNPSSGILQLEIAQDFRIANIEIINTLGQVLTRTQTSDRNSRLVLPNEAGIYFIRVEVEGKVGIYRVLKN